MVSGIRPRDLAHINYYQFAKSECSKVVSIISVLYGRLVVTIMDSSAPKQLTARKRPSVLPFQFEEAPPSHTNLREGRVNESWCQGTFARHIG